MRNSGSKNKRPSAKAAKSVDRVTVKTKLVQADNGSGWHFLEFSKAVVDKFGFEGKYKRVVCTINGGKGFQCALLPSGGLFYIIVNKKRRDELGIVADETVSVLLERDISKYGLPMPEEFQEVLDQDPEGDRLFHLLTPGKQRSLLHFTGQRKDVDERIYYSLIIIEHLKKNDGEIDHRKLHEELKSTTNRDIY